MSVCAPIRRAARRLAAILACIACLSSAELKSLNAAPPSITSQPASQIILEGSPVSFSVGATGTSPLYYLWRRDGTALAGATNSTFLFAAVSQADHNHTYSVIVSNASGTKVSSEALLRVDPGLISTQAVRLLSITNYWRYNGSNVNLGTSWNGSGFADAGWPMGPGPFDGKLPAPRTTLPNGEPVRTQLVITNAGTDIPTIYFRTHFTNTVTNAVGVILKPTFLLDDGAAVYLNGMELYRLGLISNATFATWANRTVTDPNPGFEGPFAVSWPALPQGDNVIAAEVHQVNATSSDLTFGMILDADFLLRSPDTNPPVITSTLPVNGAVVAALSAVEVSFSKDVEGVDATDLLVNGAPAASLLAITPSQYRWQFPAVTNGPLSFSWAANHAIHDITSQTNPLITANWSVTVDPNANQPRVWISEFMAANKSSIRDEDGDHSDWIELYNDDTAPVDLTGWTLTDTTNNLAKWRFPAVSIPAKGFLLVFASNKNRANPAARLHTSFSLDKSGEYLGLVTRMGWIASEFRPTFPAQQDDVSYGRDRLDPNQVGYYIAPTAGAANETTGTGFGPDVVFSMPGGTFSNSFSLSLSTPDQPSAMIRYVIISNAFLSATTNVPTASSQIYTGPLTVDRTMMVRARAFMPSGSYFPGAPHTESYIQLGANSLAFTSSLPVVVMHTLSFATIPGGDPDQGVIFSVFEPRFGVTRLTDAPTLVSRAGVNVRGSSSASYPKSPFAVELQDEFGADADREVLGMPAESDWVLYPPDCFDLSMINNPLMNAISRSAGYYAPRTRIVELFVNNIGGPLALGTSYASAFSPQYRGIYVLMEKIKRSSSRVDIDELQPENTNAPSITGGYLLKMDRVDSDEVSLVPAGYPQSAYQMMIYQDPKGPEMISAQWMAQSNYIRSYLDSFYAALISPNWTNRTLGWAPYVNWNSAIDYQLINLAVFNVDAIRLSGFFYKPRNGPLEFGPVWDCDRGLGTSRNDSRAFNPRCWIGAAARSGGDGGTDYFNSNSEFANPWYSRMSMDPDYWQAWIDRYQELRRGPFHTNALFSLISNYSAQVRTAHAREVARWGGNGHSDTSPRSGTVTIDGYTYTFNGTYDGEIAFQKKWLTDRLNFMDTNFLAAPSLSSNSGPIASQFSLVMTDHSAKAGTQLYFTLDGTDPRASFGGIAASARLYTAPVAISNNTRVVVRARNPNHANLTGAPGSPATNSIWSGPVAATFYSNIPPLRITEIMFHPPDPTAGATNDADDFEFLEFRNISTTNLNLAGFRLSGGVDFTFGNFTLAAGQSCVIASDIAAFQSRYGTSPLVAGQYTNHLANDGDHLVLEGLLKEPILDFAYDDQWYPLTDGAGFSLVIVDADAPVSTWGNKSSWRPSGTLKGSPGLSEPVSTEIPPIIINEALTHTDLPQVDSIELFNPTSSSADVSGWLLSDDFNVPAKFRMPAGTIVSPGGFKVFTEADFNPTPGISPGFVLNSEGDDVWLFSADAATNLTGYVHGFKFGAAQNGVAFGRWATSDGREQFVAQSANTFGASNAAPRIGPVVISEIYHHPPEFVTGDNTFDEFVELANVTATNTPLYDPAFPTNTWRLRNAVDFDFPTNIAIPPCGTLLVVSFDPVQDPAALATFRARLGVPETVPVFGPWDGKLDNSGEAIELNKPDPPGTNGVPHVLVESVKYSNTSPWPTLAHGAGQSLQRIDSQSFGNDPTSWFATLPTPGTPPPTQPEPPHITISVTDGQRVISFNGLPCASFTLWRSLDLTNWEPMTSGYPAPDGLWQCTDEVPPAERAFYRVTCP